MLIKRNFINQKNKMVESTIVYMFLIIILLK